MTRKILLAGGGHSHALALLYFAGRIPRGAEITLLSDSEYAPYSGMLPGFIAGQFCREECLINLPALCARAGARWKQAAAVKINCDGKRVELQNGSAEEFDILSVNVGGAPRPLFSGIGVKPVMPFMNWLETLPAAPAFAVIGAGAGGVETALALRRRFPDGSVCLIGETFLPEFNESARRRLRAVLEARKIMFIQGEAENIDGASACMRGGGAVKLNIPGGAKMHAVFATPAAAPEWLQNGGLLLDENGFVRVNQFLQSETHPAVFAAGDCAASGAPKSGVVAVRQAPVLARNILAAATGAPLRPWRLRRRRLAILNTADRRAVAVWGGFAAGGAWAWTWKKYLDKKFMNRFAPV
ncbi:MAG: FAD-dependent oxidoreductase [Gammaproteobacteria bacterium]